MKRVLIDTNVVLDVLLVREPFVEDIAPADLADQLALPPAPPVTT